MKISTLKQDQIKTDLLNVYLSAGNYIATPETDFEIYFEDNIWVACLTLQDENYKPVEIYANLSWSTKKVLKNSIEIVRR